MLIPLDIALGLMVLAFALPFIFLHFQLESMRRHAQNDHVEKQHLRHQLRALEEHVRKDKSRFLEALGVPFLLLRPSGRLVMANREAEAMLGIDANCHANLLRILPESPVRSFLEQATQSHEPLSTTLRLPREDGERFYHSGATPLGNDDRHIGIVFHDVTGEHRTMTIRRDFVANASHELRTPLTVIRGYVETLLEDDASAEDPELRNRALALIKKHVDRIGCLVEDMLALSRLENEEKGYLRQEDFDLSDVVTDVLSRLEGMAEQQHATTDIHIQPVPFLLHGDKSYWSQIMFNLAENALKNNPAPGLRIEISAFCLPGGGAQIEVADNGCGIEAEALPFIFNRFFRADSTGRVKGSGLGLAIVRHAVEAHGGTIAAESLPGIRTSFRITLPPAASR